MKYKLLKDLPVTQEGTIFIKDGETISIEGQEGRPSAWLILLFNQYYRNKDWFAPIEEKTFRRWRAEKYGSYYYVNSYGGIPSSSDLRNAEDNHRFATGNYFQTEEEAEHHKAHLLAKQELIDLIAEKNEGWGPSWRDTNDKFYFYHNSSNIPSVRINSEAFTQSYARELYMASTNIALEIIDELGEEKIKLALGFDE